jgi:hypothetical protein
MSGRLGAGRRGHEQAVLGSSWRISGKPGQPFPAQQVSLSPEDLVRTLPMHRYRRAKHCVVCRWVRNRSSLKNAASFLLWDETRGRLFPALRFANPAQRTLPKNGTCSAVSNGCPNGSATRGPGRVLVGLRNQVGRLFAPSQCFLTMSSLIHHGLWRLRRRGRFDHVPEARGLLTV